MGLQNRCANTVWASVWFSLPRNSRFTTAFISKLSSGVFIAFNYFIEVCNLHFLNYQGYWVYAWCFPLYICFLKIKFKPTAYPIHCLYSLFTVLFFYSGYEAFSKYGKHLKCHLLCIWLHLEIGKLFFFSELPRLNSFTRFGRIDAPLS